MDFLISAEWVQREAARLGVSITPDEIRKAVSTEGRRFGGLEKLANHAGLSLSAIRTRIRLDALRRKIQFRVVDRPSPPNDRQIAAYYERHKSHFRALPSREIVTVITRRKARALRAKAALLSGAGWHRAIERYAIPIAKGFASRTTIDTANTISSLRHGIFAANVGKVEGPLRVRGTWWVFEVERARPAGLRPLDESMATIRSTLRLLGKERALAEFVRTIRERYEPKTLCSPGYVVPECGND